MAYPFHIHNVIAALAALNEAETEKDGAIAVFQYLIGFRTKSVKFTSTAIENLTPFDKVYLKQSPPLFSHFGLSCIQQENPEALLVAVLYILSHRRLSLGANSYIILSDIACPDSQHGDNPGSFEVVFETKFWESLKL